MKLLNSSMWRTLRLDVEAAFWNDEAAVRNGDAANENRVDAFKAHSGGNNDEEGEFAADCTMW